MKFDFFYAYTHSFIATLGMIFLYISAIACIIGTYKIFRPIIVWVLYIIYVLCILVAATCIIALQPYLGA